ncbi:Imidazole glycerol phosphate synthase subunit HisH 1 [compost metagenome]
MIAIINYGVGNFASIYNMLRKIGIRAIVTNNAEEILNAEKIILPGVGHYDHAMTMLNRSGLRQMLDKAAIELKRPVLGICLGAQILGTKSEEGELPGLGWIDMVCKKIPTASGIRVPHMGWNAVSRKKESALFEFSAADARYYFVHSYYMECTHAVDAIGETQHGIDFTSVVQKGNIFGTQFHPEKSLRHGLAVLKAFSSLNENE